jgi:hypothetical protein
MNGADYIATVRLSTKQDETLADEGFTCERVPAESLQWLIDQGHILTFAEYDRRMKAESCIAVPMRHTEIDGWASCEVAGKPLGATDKE